MRTQGGGGGETTFLLHSWGECWTQTREARGIWIKLETKEGWKWREMGMAAIKAGR